MTYITTTHAAPSLAATPAGNQATTHVAARRGQDDPENRGRSAQVFEDYNEQHFQDEWSDMARLGALIFAALIFAGTLLAVSYVWPLLVLEAGILTH